MRTTCPAASSRARPEGTYSPVGIALRAGGRRIGAVSHAPLALTLPLAAVLLLLALRLVRRDTSRLP